MPGLTQTLPSDPVLAHFRAAVTEAYGERVERMIVFGSRARGETGRESDYDIAVFLRNLGDRFAEMDRLADLSTDILNETGAFVHVMPYRAGSYEERTPLMHEIRADGIDI